MIVLVLSSMILGVYACIAVYMLNKITLDVKSARPIRNSIVCKIRRYVQPKTLISAEAKKATSYMIVFVTWPPL